LERKLELLEARFTMPAPFPSASAPAATADTKSPSEATLGPFSSPNASASAHSFGFGTPSLSNLSSNPTNLGMHNMLHNDNSQPLPTGSIRKKRRRQSWTNNLHVVSLAAEKHMRRVAASSSSPTPLQQQEQLQQFQQEQQQQQQHLANRLGAGSPSQLSIASESNQTLITGHLRPKNTNSNAEKHSNTATGTNFTGGKPSKAAKTALVVQESPPILTPAGVAQQSLPRSDAVREAGATTTTTTTTSVTSANSGTVRCVLTSSVTGVC
jgi:hypothetical protein